MSPIVSNGENFGHYGHFGHFRVPVALTTTLGDGGPGLTLELGTSDEGAQWLLRLLVDGRERVAIEADGTVTVDCERAANLGVDLAPLVEAVGDLVIGWPTDPTAIARQRRRGASLCRSWPALDEPATERP